MDNGAQSAVFFFLSTRPELFAANWDISLHTQRHSLMLTTEKGMGRFGLVLSAALDQNLDCYLVPIMITEIISVRTVKTSVFLVVSSQLLTLIQYFHCPILCVVASQILFIGIACYRLV